MSTTKQVKLSDMSDDEVMELVDDMSDDEVTELLDSLSEDEVIKVQLLIIEKLEANGDIESAKELALILAEDTGLLH